MIDDERVPALSVIRNNGSMKIVPVSRDVLMVFKRAAWERFDSLIALGATDRAQLAIESCREIIEQSKQLPSTTPDKQPA
jgi:hypothetical protein